MVVVVDVTCLWGAGGSGGGGGVRVCAQRRRLLHYCRGAACFIIAVPSAVHVGVVVA
jgi:hypothetical protein